MVFSPKSAWRESRLLSQIFSSSVQTRRIIPGLMDRSICSKSIPIAVATEVEATAVAAHPPEWVMLPTIPFGQSGSRVSGFLRTGKLICNCWSTCRVQCRPRRNSLSRDEELMAEVAASSSGNAKRGSGILEAKKWTLEGKGERSSERVTIQVPLFFGIILILLD